MLAGIIIYTILLPILFGAIIAIATLILKSQRNFVFPILFLVFSLLVYAIVEGVPTFQTLGMKQKLPLIIVLIGLSFVPTNFDIRLERRLARYLLPVLALAGVLWLGQNFIFTNPWKLVIALIAAIAALFSARSAGSGKGAAAEISGISFLPAAFSATLAFSLAAAFGAFLGAAQLDGAMSALMGIAILILAIAFVMGRENALKFSRQANLMTAAVVVQFLAVTILFTPKISVAAVLIATLSWLVPAVLGRFANRLAALKPPLRFFACALLSFLPAALSIGVAAFVAFNGS